MLRTTTLLRTSFHFKIPKYRNNLAAITTIQTLPNLLKTESSANLVLLKLLLKR
jgi:hypothetical protein